MSWDDEVAEAPNRYWIITQEQNSLGADGLIDITLGPLGDGRWYFGDAIFLFDSDCLSVVDLVAKYIPSTSAYSFTFVSYAINGSTQYRIYDSIRGYMCALMSNDVIQVTISLVSAVHDCMIKVNGWGIVG